ncbi:MAG TPA: phosphoribosylamine--glycine ligase [Lentisphaeria bacterium]|nr:MAG: phosphoribosylamine--glycine ligase [Lentisphaerae bacterium GWF2_49_21]HBC89154.1 phosphoribosylamine--glycine ligase [Lentisphaeria bacterium]
MRILVIGSGGREHAICWKLVQSPKTEKVYCAPGNAGIANVAECLDIAATDIDKLLKFAKEKYINLTVVGPEAPLCDGIVDAFRRENLPVFGPDKSSARLEGSKSFAKMFMMKNGIPTAASRGFTEEVQAIAHVKTLFTANPPPKGVVVKADGLAAGKGVILAYNLKEANDAINLCFRGTFGDAGKKVIIEDLLVGEETSILALTDGNTIVPLVTSQDHKRAGDRDTGPNTGGMGAYSPAPVVTEKMFQEIDEKVLQKFLKGIKDEKLYYRGIIYAGIMITAEGPKVLEFNVRFGDPETQAVLMRLESDLAEVMLKTSLGRLNEVKLKWTDEPAVCIVMASGGYPGSYKKGFPITGLEEAEATGAVVFHAGTAIQDGKIVNSGGRVLGVTAKGANIKDAIDNAYKAVNEIYWLECFFRKDIGHKALERKQ